MRLEALITKGLSHNEAVAKVRTDAETGDEAGEGGENTVTAQIRSHVYVGTYTRFKVEVGRSEFEVVAEASSVERFQDGEVLPLTFPREKIWLVPPEA